MLGIKKVKVHGFADKRWTTQDKITQFKGITNLYLRDQKIVNTDSIVQLKKLNKEIKQLKKYITEDRYKLESAMYGDKQILSNLLSNNLDLKLAYQNLMPARILENIHQINFNKRKKLDLINYKKKQKSEKLIDLKMHEAQLEDNLKYASDEKLPIEITGSILTGKLQDAYLKREAALTVWTTYNDILDVLKKDSIYMFHVLEALKEDTKEQCKCMLNTTELGQLATEYLDDRRNEFRALEIAIKTDMALRRLSLQEVENEVERIEGNLSKMLRRDSDVTLCIMKKMYVHDFNSENGCDIKDNIAALENTLNYLKNTLAVSDFQSIIPCIKEQQNTTERLSELVNKLQNFRDGMEKKLKHTHHMYKQLTFAKGDTRYGFDLEKQRLKILIEDQKERKRKIDMKRTFKCEVLLKIRIALQRIEQMCRILGKERRVMLSVDSSAGVFEDYKDAKTLIDELATKLILLISFTDKELLEDEEVVGVKTYQNLITRITCLVDTSTKIEDESLLAGITFEDPSIPTRQEIKKKSEEIVRVNSIKEEDLLPPPTRKKKFK